MKIDTIKYVPIILCKAHFIKTLFSYLPINPRAMSLLIGCVTKLVQSSSYREFLTKLKGLFKICLFPDKCSCVKEELLMFLSDYSDMREEESANEEQCQYFLMSISRSP